MDAVNMRERFRGVPLQEIILWAERMLRESEAVVKVHEIVRAWPLDGARAFKKAVDKMFGWSETIAGTNVSMEIGPEQYENVPVGKIMVPGVDGTLECGFGNDDDIPAFFIQGQCKQKDLDKVQKLAELTRKIQRTESAYKGKALIVEPCDGGMFKASGIFSNPPKFFALNGLTKDDLVLPEDVARDVNAAVFSTIEDVKMVRGRGLPTKRSIVLDGAPGTGKTLTMTIAAKCCVESGRTFILLRDIDYLEDCIKLVVKYNLGPALIAAEDIDRRMFERDDQANRLLNAIDGVDSKSLDILFLLTTNCKDKLIDTFRRSGRSDWIITLPVPDAYAAATLLKRYSDEYFDVSGEDYLKIGRILADARTLPSNIAEVCRRASYYQIAERKECIDFGLLAHVARKVVEEKAMPEGRKAVRMGMVEDVDRKVQAIVDHIGIELPGEAVN